jgi:hypothetical protein
VWPGTVTDAQHFWHFFSGMNSMMAIPWRTPYCGNKSHPKLPLSQHFHWISIQQFPFLGPTYHFIFFHSDTTNYQEKWLMTFSGHLTHASMTPIHYTLLAPHNCSSTTLDPEDEGTTVRQYAGNYSPNNIAAHPSRFSSSTCSILIPYNYNHTSDTCITSVMFIVWWDYVTRNCCF